MHKQQRVILHIETSRACGRGILLGIARYSQLYSMWQITQQLPFYLDNKTNNRHNESSWPERWLADGMIVARPEVPQEIMEIGIPIIGIDVREPIPGLPNIVGDAYAIADLAINHFLERGFKNIAYCGFSNITWALERGDAFEQKLNEAGLQMHCFYQPEITNRSSWDDQIILLSEWLKKLPKPLAIFACNDDCSKQINQACKMLSLRVPDDIAILGVDNDEMICLPSSPPLSSIVLNFERAGFEAAQLLDRMITGKEKPQDQKIFLKPTHIITRQSTDVLAIEDADVSRAVRFIYQNANHVIQVNDIVKEVAISRRKLENKFRAILGHSINSEIRRIRVQRISQMLIETNQSIEQIAINLGYTDATHISRYFRKEKGISPQAYRKSFG